MYKYFGIPEKTLMFTPKDLGLYKIDLLNTKNNKLIQELNFTIFEKENNLHKGKDYFYFEIDNTTNKNLVYTDKKSYQKNEIVIIYINNLSSNYNI